MTQEQVNKLSQVQRAKLMRQLLKAGGDVTVSMHTKANFFIIRDTYKHTHVVVNCGQTATYVEFHPKKMHP